MTVAPSGVRIPGGDPGQGELHARRPLQVWCLGVTPILPERVQGGSIINS